MQLSLALLSLAITSVALAAPQPVAREVVLQPFEGLNKFCKDGSDTRAQSLSNDASSIELFHLSPSCASTAPRFWLLIRRIVSEMKRDTLEKLTVLEYPVTRPFPSSWRCFGLLVLLLCIPVLVLLTLLNVSTVGRESVAVESSDFADDSRSWWAILSGTLSARACEPHHFLLGDIFRTTLGSFDYSLVSVDLSNGKPEATDIAASASSNLSLDAPAYGFEYRMESIAENCYSSNATSRTSLRTLIVTADLSTFTVTGMVAFSCSNPNDSVVQLRLSHMTAPLDPSVESYWTSLSLGVNPDTQNDGYRLVVRGLVDLLAVDLLQSMRFAFAGEESSLVQITASGRMNCQAAPSLLKPVDLECPFYAQIPVVEGAVGRVSRAGDIEFIDLADSSFMYPAGLTISQLNYFSVLASASLIDIGKWAGNPLLSREWFNLTVDPNDEVSTLYRNQQGLRSVMIGNTTFPTPSKSLFYNQSLSNAALLRSLPTMVLNDTLLPPPVWAVLVADISLFTALWGIFMLIATALAQRSVDSTSRASGSTEKPSPSASKPVLPPLDSDITQQTLPYNSRLATAAASPTSVDYGISEGEGEGR
ncbi:hypothetical protein BCR35DRAFT_325837 [Leucosporidium creatinivorum]|uniref:Aspartic peptidase domain-containing protein n=1 Tax=Leucosporidium creatinivorum TaxID=106004 RepID=A0A1Y2EUS3_9BASI|nr:hypothetical protein BCR35DRAFT_325837 [Leucosporidium creatinivorum]